MTIKEMTDIVTTTFHVIDHIYVDIVETPNGEYEAWIYNSNYSVKDFMFGVEKNGMGIIPFINMVENNIEDYIGFYSDEVMAERR